MNTERPFIFINVAMSADGKIDTYERKGAAISSQRDKQRVDELRAAADAILVGGKTLIEEMPKLTVKSDALREGRIMRGLSPNPIKVGVATVADISLDCDFINAGPARKVIFTTNQTSIEKIESLRAKDVEVIARDFPRADLTVMAQTLKKMGVDRLMVEGGGTMNFELIRLGLVDELAIYVAPMIFGGASSPTLADGLGLARSAAVELKLKDMERWDDAVVLKYSVV